MPLSQQEALIPYELFTRKRTHGGPPAVTVTKNGIFVINGSALSKYISPNSFIQVYWDKEAGKVGLKPLGKKADKAYHVNVSPKGNVGSISALAFLKYVGYDSKETKSFPASWNEREGLLEFKLYDGPKRFPRVRDEE